MTRCAVCGLLVLALVAGCSSEARRVDYQSTVLSRPLEVPPELAKPADPAAILDSGAAATPSSGYSVAVATARVGVRVERAGTQRWLVVDEEADKLWPRLKAFFYQHTMAIGREDAALGLMETVWLELPAFTGAAGQSTRGAARVRDQYHLRIERTADPKVTEVFLSHRGVVEAAADVNGKRALVWQTRAPEPELEAEFLRRLVLFLGKEPARAVAAAPEAQRAVLEKTDGLRLRLDEDFDRAWRRVGLALDRAGFVVEDRDRSRAVFFVRYRDAAAEQDSGWFSSGGKSADAARYEVRLTVGVGRTDVAVFDAKGVAAAPAPAERILALLQQQLK